MLSGILVIVWIGEWIYWPRTSNYNAIANLHTLKITKAHAKSSQFVFTSRFLVTDLNIGDSSASVLMPFLSDKYPTSVIPLNFSAISSRTLLRNSTERSGPNCSGYKSRHGPHRKHVYSIVAFASVTAGTYFRSCCPETGCVYPFIKNLLP
jgi:hypothetical protein